MWKPAFSATGNTLNTHTPLLNPIHINVQHLNVGTNSIHQVAYMHTREKLKIEVGDKESAASADINSGLYLACTH